jgi:hypothetical protein
VSVFDTANVFVWVMSRMGGFDVISVQGIGKLFKQS